MPRPGAGGGGGPRISSGSSRPVSRQGGGGSHRIGSSSPSSRPSSLGSRTSASFSSSKPSSLGSSKPKPAASPVFSTRPSTPPPRQEPKVNINMNIGRPAPPPPPPRHREPSVRVDLGGRSGMHVSVVTGRPTPPPPPPPPRHHTTVVYRESGGNNGKGNGVVALLVSLTAIFVFISALLLLSYTLNKPRAQQSSYAREKLTDVPAYRNSNIVDEMGWFDNPSRVSSNLKDFYDATGIQPYVVIKAYDDYYTTDKLQEEWAADYYDNNIDVDNGFLIVLYEDGYDDVQNVCYWYGARTPAVMDAEAIDIFFNHFDNYWEISSSMDNFVVDTFNATSKIIMQRSKTGTDVAFVVLPIIMIIVAIILFIVAVKVKRKAGREEAEETQRILSQPLPSYSTGSAETDAIADKYK